MSDTALKVVRKSWQAWLWKSFSQPRPCGTGTNIFFMSEKLYRQRQTICMSNKQKIGRWCRIINVEPFRNYDAFLNCGTMSVSVLMTNNASEPNTCKHQDLLSQTLKSRNCLRLKSKFDHWIKH